MPNYSLQPIKMSKLEVLFNLFMHLRKLFMVSHLLKKHYLIRINRAVIFIWSLQWLWWYGWVRYVEVILITDQRDGGPLVPRPGFFLTSQLKHQVLMFTVHEFTGAGPLWITKSKKAWLSAWFNPIWTGRGNVQKYHSLKHTFESCFIFYTLIWRTT